MNRGFWVSILLHILLISLPITITDVRESKEIKIFIMEETPNPVLFRPAVHEQRLMERPQTIILKPIEQELVEKLNSLLKPSVVEEKKVENESVMEAQKYEMEPHFEKKSEAIPQLPLTSILEAERKEKEAKELARLKEEEAKRALAEKELATERERLIRLESEGREKEAKELAKLKEEEAQRVRDEKEARELPKADLGVRSASKHTDPSQYWTAFGEEEGPRFLHQEKPIYPIKARRLGKEGKVVLKLIIDENGNLLNVEVLEKAGYGFTAAAVEAVKKSTFLPAKKKGKPIASQALLPIRFQLD